MGGAVSARVEAAGGRAGGPEARREARGFGDCLEAARRVAGQQWAAAAARRAASGGQIGSEAGASPVAALSRRRAQADRLDEGLALERRRLEGAERAGDERRAEAPPPATASPAAPRQVTAPGAAGPRAADLAAAVERLAVAVERRDRALGPELRLDLGGRLSVRLASGEKGIEVVFAGEAGMARLARAEMPEVLARLRERGIAVSRCEVRVAPGPAASGGGTASARAPRALTAGEASATSGFRHGTVAKW